MTYIKQANNIIKSNRYMNFATCNLNGIPWISTVYFVNDRSYSFYWTSPVKSRHSRNIRNNPNIAINIYDSSAVVDDIAAVYLEAEATEILDPMELLNGMAVFGKQALKSDFIRLIKDVTAIANKRKDFVNDSPLRFYKASTKKMWLLAPSEMYNGHYVDSRIPVRF